MSGQTGRSGETWETGGSRETGDRWSSLVVGGWLSISEYSGSAPLVSRFLGFLGF